MSKVCLFGYAIRRAQFCAYSSYQLIKYWIMNAPSIENDAVNAGKGSGAREDPVFQVEEVSGTVDRPKDDDDLHIPESEMSYLRSKIHVRMRKTCYIYRRHLTQHSTMQ